MKYSFILQISDFPGDAQVWFLICSTLKDRSFPSNTYASKMVGRRRSIWNFWCGPKIYSKRLCSHSRAFLGKCQTAEPLFCISNQQVDTFTTTATLLAKMSGISTFAKILMARALFLYLTSEVYRTDIDL